MQIDEKTFKRLPERLQALFVKLPNPGSDEVLEAFARFGERKVAPCGPNPGNGKNGGIFNIKGEAPATACYSDTGTAARFFFSAKASREEREIGLYDQPAQVKPATWGDIGAVEDNPRKPASGHVQRIRNTHPTVKPLALMQWLCRMVTPPGGTVLDMFAGSGSTGIAADREGFNAILIERELEYVTIARRRIAGDAPLLTELIACA